ncbi:hypothetical protein ACG83_38655 [Frankia sp. R43]|nr:hypothetical protein ACG83_38655 [Frankia sp. R43]
MGNPGTIRLDYHLRCHDLGEGHFLFDNPAVRMMRPVSVLGEEVRPAPQIAARDEGEAMAETGARRLDHSTTGPCHNIDHRFFKFFP